MSEDRNFERKSTSSKTDYSSCFGITTKKLPHKKMVAKEEIVEERNKEVLQFVKAHKDEILGFITCTIEEKVIKSALKLKISCPEKSLLVFCMQDKTRFDAAVQASASIVGKFPQLEGFFK